MKTLFVLLVCVFMFVACNKENDVIIINYEAVKAELAAQKNPEKQEFIDVINSSAPKLKAASKIISIIEAFPLAEVTFEVHETYAVKKFVLYYISNQGERLDLLTMLQQFQIINGKLDTSGYSIEYKTGCDDSEFFDINIPQGVYILELTCTFHFENGSEFAYRIFNGNLNRVKLPNIGKGKWEISAITDDGDLPRRQTTGFIDYDYEGNQLYLVPQPKEVNVVAKLSIPKENLEGVYSIKVWAEDPETGEEIWIYIPFVFNRELSNKNLLFSLPFHPQGVVLMSDMFPWQEYYGNDMIAIQEDGGLPTYFIN